MNRAVFDKLAKLFRNAHAIAKNNRPFSDYVQVDGNNYMTN